MSRGLKAGEWYPTKEKFWGGLRTHQGHQGSILKAKYNQKFLEFRPHYWFVQFLKYCFITNSLIFFIIAKLVAPKNLTINFSDFSTKIGGFIYFEVFTSLPRGRMAANKTLPFLDGGSVATTPNLTPNLCPPNLTPNNLQYNH